MSVNQNHSDILTLAISNITTWNYLTDAVFICKDGPVPATKIVLASLSSMLCILLNDEDLREENMVKIFIPDFSADQVIGYINRRILHQEPFLTDKEIDMALGCFSIEVSELNKSSHTLTQWQNLDPEDQELLDCVDINQVSINDELRKRHKDINSRHISLNKENTIAIPMNQLSNKKGEINNLKCTKARQIAKAIGCPLCSASYTKQSGLLRHALTKHNRLLTGWKTENETQFSRADKSNFKGSLSVYEATRNFHRGDIIKVDLSNPYTRQKYTRQIRTSLIKMSPKLAEIIMKVNIHFIGKITGTEIALAKLDSSGENAMVIRGNYKQIQSTYSYLVQLITKRTK